MELDRDFIRLVLVGVDGSEGAHHAVEWAARLATVTGAEVLALHVLTYNRELVRDISVDTMRTWRRDLERDLRTKWIAPLVARGVVHRYEIVEHDSPAGGLIEVGERDGADLVVVGAKGRANLAGRLLGSVSYRVTHGAHRPVVVVPTPPTSPPPPASGSN
jgi:nucleotide-binding universal stress UspA family protein